MNKGFFLLIWLLFACSQKDTNEKQGRDVRISDDFKGTKWSFKIDTGCINSYEFKPTDVYVFHSCEMDDTYYGKYFVKDDTLHLYEFLTATDTLFPADSPGQSEKVKFKIVMIDDKLKHVARFDKVNGVWRKSKLNLPADHLYKKEF